MDIEKIMEWVGKYWMMLFLLLLNISVCLYALANIRIATDTHDKYYIDLLHKYCPQAVSVGMILTPPPFNISSWNVS
jgi:hypothetical protein